jgi:uncharacterized membrane protein
MAPEGSLPSNSMSDAVFDANSSGTEDLKLLIERLSARMDALEQTVGALSYKTEDSTSSREPLPVHFLATPQEYSTEIPFAVSVDAASPTHTPRSLEDRLGSQIFNRVGIIALLIGATWFLKLAMDNHWIGPLGRILIGLIAGTGIVVWSERFRRHEFAAFSYSLKAVGTGVLCLSLWASFQLYHLVPAEAAFGLMLMVTLWNAWMAWSQQSELLATYAIAGGFATPILLSTGGNHQVFLFSYLLTLDLATIALVRLAAARSRSWSRLLACVLPGTIAYFIAWYSRFYTADQLASSSIFISLFFIAFFTVPLRGSSREPEVSTKAEPISDILLPLTNAVFTSLAFYSVLEDSGNHAWLPWMSLFFAAIYLAATRLPEFARMQTEMARAVHLTLSVVFLTVAIPLKANGRWITIGWLVEGVALLWVSARLDHQGDKPGASAHRVLQHLSLLALLLGFLGLAATPLWLDRSIQTAILNRRFATELAGIVAFAAATWISLWAANASLRNLKTSPGWLRLAAISIVALNLIALQAGVLEIRTFWAAGTTCYDCGKVALQTALSISAFLMLYGAGLLAVGFWKHNAFLRWQGLGLLSIAIIKTFLYDVRSLSQGYRVASFLGLGALLMAVSFAYVQKSARNTPDRHP